MDEQPDQCPNRATLKAWLQGGLAANQKDSVTSHVDECFRCDETIQNLEAETDQGLRLPFGLEKTSVAGSGDYAELVADLKAIPLDADHGDQVDPSKTESRLDDELTGTRLGQYELLEQIGRGGMGTVYKARHQKLDRIVALKVLPGISFREPQAVARFEREIKAIGKLSHPNIVQALDADEVDGTHFLVMEHIAGRDLGQLIRQSGVPSVAGACEMIRQAALGLQAVHEAGLVHRDIKPSNLLVDESGTVRILDLGLALLGADHESSSDLTSTNQVMGTADYIAPEQALDTHNVDIRADIYSLGCTLFHLLTGQPPFRSEKGSNAIRTMLAHANEPAPSVQSMSPDVSDELASLVDRLLAKKPEDRPQTPDEVARLLLPFAGSEAVTSIVSVDKLPTQDSLPRIEIVESLQAKPDQLARSSQSRSWSPLRTLLGLIGSVLLGIILLQLITPHGTINVEVPEDATKEQLDELKIEFRGNGPVKVADAKHGWTIDVDQMGEFSVNVSGGSDRFTVQKKTVTVTRGGQEVVKVSFVGKVAHVPQVVKVEPLPKTAVAKSPTDVIRDQGRDVWPVGPVENVLQGEILRPAEFDGIKRWNVVRSAHSDEVNAASWSPDGRYLAVTTRRSNVRLYELSDGSLKLERLLPWGNWNDLTDAKWSPDGKWLATSCNRVQARTTVIQLWDAKTFEPGPSHERQHSHGCRDALSWGSDSAELAIGCGPGIAVWNIESDAVTVVAEKETGFRQLAWSPDGKKFAASPTSARNETRVFSSSGELLQSFKRSRETAPLDIEWSPDGKWLACGAHGPYGGGGSAQVIRTDPWELASSVGAGHYSLAWEPNGNRLAMVKKSGGDSHFYFDVHSAGTFNIEQTIELPRTTSGIYRLAWCPQTQWMAVVWDGTIYLYDIQSEQLAQTIGCNNDVRSASWSANGQRLGIALDDGTTRICSKQGESIAFLRTHPRMPVSSSANAVLNEDGTSVAASWNDGRNWNMRVFDVASGESVGQLRQQLIGLPTSDVSWAPRNSLLAVAAWEGDSGDDPRIRLWNPKTDASTYLRGHTMPGIIRFGWNRDGTRLASTGPDNTIRIWDVPMLSQISSVEKSDQALDLQFSPDGETVAVQCRSELHLIDVQTGRAVSHPANISKPYQYLGIWFTHENDLVSMDEGRLILRDGKTGQVIREQSPETPFWCTKATPSPDGTRLALQRGHYALDVRDSTTFEPLWLGIAVSDVHMAAFTPAGQLMNPDPEVVKDLAWIVEQDDGRLEVLTRDEFLRRINR